MAKKEILTDLWVYELLKEANIDLQPQGSSIKDIDNALKLASKAGTGKVGYPEYSGIVKDFVLIISVHPVATTGCKNLLLKRLQDKKRSLFHRSPSSEETNNRQEERIWRSSTRCHSKRKPYMAP